MIKMSNEYAFATMKIKDIVCNAKNLATKKEVAKSRIELVLDFAETFKDNKETKLLVKNVRSVIDNKSLDRKEMLEGVMTMISATNFALYC